MRIPQRGGEAAGANSLMRAAPMKATRIALHATVLMSSPTNSEAE